MQPRHEALEAYNTRLQETLRTTAAASTATNNWWRTTGGRVTVVNPVTGREMRRRAWRQPAWEDWEATRNGEVVDVVGIQRDRRRKRGLVGLAGLMAMTLLYLCAV